MKIYVVERIDLSIDVSRNETIPEGVVQGKQQEKRSILDVAIRISADWDYSPTNVANRVVDRPNTS